MNARFARNVGFALLLGCIGVLAGCFSSKFVVAPPDAATVNVQFCGNWEVADADQPQKPSAKLVIRNLDGKRYVVTWLAGDEKPLVMTGYTIDVKGSTFAELQGLPDDGTAPENDFLLMRVERKDDKLILRNLDDKFFKDKIVESNDQLRKLVEDNLDNDAMYDKDSIIATKMPSK